jgi:hypothetical protein
MQNVVNDLLFRLYERTHHLLFSTAEGTAVIEALLEAGIESEVLHHSMVGVFTPQCDTQAFFQDAIRTAKSAIESLETAKPKGRPPTNAYVSAKEEAESHLATLCRIEAEIAKAAREFAGGLSCFYTDEGHNIVGCQMLPRDGERDGLWIDGAQPHRRGLFNHGLFGRSRHSGLMSGPDKLLLVEDCRSVLQIQSALYRAATERGESGRNTYAWVASLPELIDGQAVRETCRTPVFCYSPTAAGRARVEGLREYVTLSAFVGPAGRTIGDAVIAADSGERGVAELARRIAEAELFTRPFRAVRTETDDLRRREGPLGLKKFEADRWASDIIGRDLSERGRLYHDGRIGYVLLFDTREVIPFDPDNDEYRLLVDGYGVSGRDALFKPLLEHLGVRARKYGTQSEVHASSYFDRERFVCYVFNNRDVVYRIDGRGVEPVPNGTDGVLFVTDPKRQPWTLTVGPRKVDLAGTLFGQIRFDESTLSVWGAWFLMLVWFYSMFFRPLFPTRVILALVGDKGSGKTTLLKRMGRLVLGPKFEVTDISNDAKDLDAAFTGQPFVVIDNADRAIPWLDDKLAIAATGGNIKRRILYTTNKLAEFPIVAWVGITSRTPYFRREDVADRLLLINVERFESFSSANQLDEDIERHRDALMTEVVHTIQKIVQEVERQKNLQLSTTFRMADFAEFAVKIAPVFRVERPEVEQFLRDLATVQLEFTSVDEPLLLHLDDWLATEGNVSRWVSTKEFFNRLHDRWAVSRPGTFPWRDPRQLGQQITGLRSTLETHYGYEEETRRGGTRWIRFNSRREDDYPQAARGKPVSVIGARSSAARRSEKAAAPMTYEEATRLTEHWFSDPRR